MKKSDVLLNKLSVDMMVDNEGAEQDLYRLAKVAVGLSKEKDDESIDEIIKFLEENVVSSTVDEDFDQKSFVLGQAYMLSTMLNYLREMKNNGEIKEQKKIRT